MLIDIASAQQLGLLVRATRKTQRIRMDDVAGSTGVGHVFVREVERGKETVQLGRVLRLLTELGLQVKVDIPDAAAPEYARLRLAGVKPLKPRRPSTKRGTPSGETQSKGAGARVPNDDEGGA